jgi:hypothetical protein
MMKIKLIACVAILFLSFSASASGPIHNQKLLENGHETLAGADLNDNGIRDDIELYIDDLAIDERLKPSIRQYASALHVIMKKDFASPELFYQHEKVRLNAVNCMINSFFYLDEHGESANDSVRYMRKIIELTANTEDRLMQYEHYTLRKNKLSVKYPSGDTCE